MGQNCDVTTPTFNVNLIGQPSGIWNSPAVIREGYCCGITNGSDRCIQFNLTLDDLTAAINFDVTSGALPGGAMYYQVNCGPMTQVGDPVCLTGSGPFVITFCKPGNNLNTYMITAIEGPSARGPEYISQTCKGVMITGGMIESTVTWQSVPNNPTYNSYLSCTSGCDSVTVTPPSSGAPPYIDYRVFGNISGTCGIVTFADTLRIYFLSDLNVNIVPVNPSVCQGGSNITLTAMPTGGLQPYHYTWNTGDTTSSISAGAGNYNVIVTDEFNCSTADTSITVTTYPSPIICNAGPNGQMCVNSNFYTLNGSVTAATGGQWYGSGIFDPNSTTLNAKYYPTASEISNGFADVRLVTTGNQGCPALTDTVRILIRQNPAPQISGNLQSCQFNTYQYTTPYVSGNTYQWFVNGGTIISQNADTINIKWDTTGTHQLSVREINSFGCDSVVAVNVTVHQKPSPVITPQTNICEHTVQMYSVQSPSGINSYSWNITGGFIDDDDEDTITVKWDGSGPGTLTVTEMNVAGCDSTIGANYTIMNRPEPLISGIDSICQFITSLHTVPHTTGNQYQWNVSNGNIVSQTDSTVVVDWINDGLNQITLLETAINGCDSLTSFDVFVKRSPMPDITGPTEVCTGVQNVFVASNLIPGETIISWSAPGSVVKGVTYNPTIALTYNSPGTFTITLQVLNPSGCDSTITHSVTVYETPAPVVSGVDFVCYNQVETYSVSYTPGWQYFWSVTNGTVVSADSNIAVIQWSGSDTGYVAVREVNYICEKKDSLPVIILPMLKPVLTGPTGACGGFTSTFVVDSLNVNESIQWTVSGGTVSGSMIDDTLQITWPDSGLFNIDVNISNVLGCDTTLSISVDVTPVPRPLFSGPQLVCINQTSVYTATDTTSEIYSWNVTNGTITSQTDSSITVNWNSDGVVNVELTAANGSCDTTIFLPVTILPQPDPAITGAQVVCDAGIELYQAANILPHEIINWQVFGGTAQSPNDEEDFYVLWNDTGFQQLTLIVSNVPGCADTIIYPVYVNLQPQSNIAGTSIVCNGQVENYSVQFNPGSIYNWSVIGGNIISQDSSNLVVEWNLSGNGSVSVSEINNGVCTSTDLFVVTVLPELTPVINGPAIVCTDEVFQFTASGIVANQALQWNVSGGTIIGTDTGSVCDFLWDSLGIYSIQLTVTNQLGCDTIISIPVEVLETPEPAIAGAKKICVNSVVTYTTVFDSTSTYTWTVQNGNILYQNSDKITVHWDSSGTGIISVTESNQGICITTVSDTIQVLPYPDPSITGPTPICSGGLYQYIVNNIDTNESVSWSVDSGTISGFTDQDTLNVSWPISLTGNYSIHLYATNEIGCDTMIDYPVTVILQPTPVISGDNTVCTEQTSTYTVAYNSGSVYNWSVSQGTIISQLDTSVTILWDGTGTGIVTLLEINSGLCDSTVNFPVTILPEINPTVSGVQTICSLLQANYVVSGLNAGQTIAWTVTGGILQTSSTNDTITVLWDNEGSHSVQVEISNMLGCDTVISYPVTVILQPTPVIAGDNLVCTDQAAAYTVAYNAGSVYNWSVTQGTIISQLDNNITVQWDGVGTGTVTVTEINNGFCDSTVSLSVTILPEINPTVSGIQTICSGLQAVYVVTGVNAGQSIDWTVSGGILQSSSTNDTITVLWNNQGSHNVQVYISNILACDAAINYPVTVILQPTPVIVGDNLVCTDQVSTYTVDFNAGSVYNWSVSQGTIVSQVDSTVTILWDGVGTGTVTLTEINNGFCDSTVNLSVTILPEINPTVIGIQMICSGNQTNYVASGVNAGQTIAWTVTGGILQSSLTNDTISVLWDNEGSHSVQVYISNVLGCDTTIDFPVTVILQPTPVITGDNIVCSDQVSTYTVDYNVGSVYSWTVTNGTFIDSVDNEITIMWDGSGTGSISLTETNSGFCVSTVNYSVTILPPINPTVTGAQKAQIICSGLLTNYFLSGVNTGQIILWQVNGGQLQTSPSNDTITVLWDVVGSHNVQVQVSNILGCDTIINFPVTVIHQPNPVVTGDTLVCTNQITTYTVTDNAGSLYNWSVTQGTIISQVDSSVTIQWDSAGTGTVTIQEVNTGICDSTVSFSVTILPELNPTVSGVQTICSDLQTNYVVSGINPGQSISWTVTGGVLQTSSTNDTITVLWNNEGSHNVQVYISNVLGCDTVINHPVTVILQPTPVITGDNLVCTDQVSTYTVDYNVGSVYNWSVSQGTIISQIDSSVTIQWDGTGTGIVTLTEVNNGFCDSTVTFAVTILPEINPVVSGVQTICSDLQTNYVVSGVNAGQSVSWTVTGGILQTSSTNDTITVLWNNEGSHNVQVYISNVLGCDTVINHPVTVILQPTPVIAGDNLVCTDQVSTYTVDYNVGSVYNWSVSQGTIISQIDSSVTVQWDGTGTGIVTLTEVNNGFCDSTVTFAVTILPEINPTVSGVQTICSDLQINYVVSGINPGQSISWTVIGGILQTSSTNDTITVLWNNEGSHNVQVYISNVLGCDTVINHPVTVILQPTPVIAGDNLVCTDQVSTYTVDYNVGSVYNWSVSQGTIISQIDSSVTIQWDGTGTGIVTLTEVNNGFCDSTVTFAVTILPEINPTVSGVQTICSDLQTNYVVSGINPGQSVSWTIIGGILQTSSTNDTITVLWNNEGSHNVQVYISNVLGCDTVINHPVTVILQPTPVIAGDNLVCTDQTSTYTVDYNVGSVYNWSVSQGTIISQIDSSVTIQWDGTGTGIVTLTEVNNGFCDSTVTFAVTILPEINPVVSGVQTICSDLQTNYVVSGVNAGQSISWTITGGVLQTSSTNDTITVLWNNEGSHNVQVYISNVLGCDTVINHPVTVILQPTPVITGDNLVCTDQVSTYTVDYNVGSVYNWSVSQGTIISQVDSSVTIQWDGTGTGIVTLTEVNNGFCDSTVTFAVTILPEINPVVSGVQTICSDLQTNYVVSGVNAGQSISWTITGGILQTSSTNDTITVLWNNEGSHNVQVYISNVLGCDTVINHPVTVILQPTPVISGDTLVCTDQISTYTVDYNTGSVYNWTVTNGTVIDSTDNNITIQWDGSGTGTISLTENNSGFCDSTVSFTVNILPEINPTIKGAQKSQTICSGLQTSYYVIGLNAGQSISWQVIGGVLQSIATNDTINVLWDTEGNHMVQVYISNILGCDTTVYYPVTVILQPTPVISGDTLVCTDQVSTYTVRYNVSSVYSWSVSQGTIINQLDTSVTIQWDGTGTGTVTLTEVNSGLCDSTVNLTVEILPEINPTISGFQTICSGLQASYVVSGVNAGELINWSVTGGTLQSSSTNDTINVLWNNIGSHNIQVHVSNILTCDTLINYPVTVILQPAPVISGDNLVCTDQVSSYTVNYNIGSVYTWTVTNGSIIDSTNNNVTIQWDGTGSGTVTLTEINTGLCDSTVNYSVTILPEINPVVSGVQTICSDLQTNYVVSGISPGQSILWTVTGGILQTTSTNDTITVLWNNEGSHNVQVYISNVLGCDTVINHPVTVILQPTPVIAGDNLVCTDQTSTYTVDYNVGSVYNWSVSQGTFISQIDSSVTVQWDGTGTGIVTLTEVNNGFCDSTVTFAVTILPEINPTVSGAQTICSDLQTNYVVSGINPGQSVSWTVTGGILQTSSTNDTITVLWNNEGSHNVQVYISNVLGCDTVINHPVTVILQPTPVIAGDNLVCTDQVSTYTVDYNVGSVYNWNASQGTIISQIDSSVTIQWDGTGTGIVTLTEINTGLCDSTVNYSVTILPEINPTVSGVQTICSGLQTSYVVSGINAGQSIAWTVSGGTLQSPSINDTISVLWNNIGSHNVQVQISNVLGCDTLIDYPITVILQPTPVIIGDTLVCTDQVSTYTVNYNIGSVYNWTVTNGTVIDTTDNNITIQWDGAGIGTVSLTEINTGLCDSTVDYSVTILPEINPTITGIQTICSDLQTNYVVSGINAGQLIAWTVSGGTLQSSSTNDTISVLWNNIGSHNVQVYISNVLGCDTMINHPVTVILQPTPVISGDTLVCTDQISTYTVVYNIGSVYNWTVTNGTVIDSTDNNITIQWDGAGTGTVSLTEINTNLCDSTVNYSVTILPEINPTITGIQTICSDLQTNYVVSGISQGQSISWTVTGGILQTSSTNDTITVLWNNEGSHNVQVYISNVLGCDTVINYPVTVILQPTPVISGDTLVCTDQISTYTVVYNIGSVYNWTVTKGTVIDSTDNNITIQWDGIGIGNVSLTEINTGLCDSTVNYSVTILPEINPTVSGVQTICSDLQTNYVVSGISPGQSISWTVTGGILQTSPTNDTITVLWNNEGSHNVQVYISNALGCDTVINYPVTVILQPTPIITGDSLVCTDQVSTYAVNYNIGSVYNWTVTNGTVIDSTDNNITILWDGAGTGTVSLTEINTGLCDSTVNYSVTILPEINPTITGVQTICSDLQTNYVVSGVNAGQAISWTVTGGILQTSSTNDTITVLWDNEGSHNVQVYISNVLGCDTVINHPVTVILQPTPVIAGDNLVCTDQTSTYTVDYNVGSVYNWSVTQGTIISQVDSSVTVQWDGTGTGIVTLTEVNNSFCDSTVTFSVTILPEINPTVSGVQTICSGLQVSYVVSGVNAGQLIAWTVTGGVLQTSSTNDTISVLWNNIGSHNVQVEISNVLGCDTIINYPVTVILQPTPVISGDTIVCTDQISTYVVVYNTGSVYNWTVTNGTVIDTTDNNITIQWDGAGIGRLHVPGTA